MSDVMTFVVRPSMVLIVGLCALWSLRKQPAALRHWILAAALALAVTQPVINRVIPTLRIPVMGWSDKTVAVVPVAPEALVATQMAFDLGSVATVAPAAGIDWSSLVYRVWLAGVALSLAMLAVAVIWLTWLGALARPAGENWRDAEAALRRHVGIRRPVRLLITRHPAMLVTWGAIAPVILLPADAGAWPADRIRLVLAHEMAHIVRRDWLIQACAEIARAVNWFNPLFWIACSRMRRDSEHACDDIVLESGIQGTSYAEHLVALARTFSTHGRTWLPAPSIARPSTLERRVRAMLNPQVDRRPVSRMRRAALAVALVVIALPIASASQAPGTTSGTIADPSGRPLADAVVRLVSVNGDATFEARTDANGAFQLGDVPAGDYLLAASSPGFSTQRQRLRISGGYTFALRLAVGTLRERVTVRSDGSGSGASGPRTEVRAPSYQAPACAPASTGGQLIPPMKLKDVRPRYKQAWVANNFEGEILMKATIGLDGRVRNVDVISPVNMELDDEAIAAVSQWEFSPTYLNCEPVEVQMYVTVSFKIDR